MFLLKAVLAAAAKIAGASTVAQVAAGVGLTMASVTGAGAAGVLPTPVQDGVAHAVEAVTPFNLPDSSDVPEPVHTEATESEPTSAASPSSEAEVETEVAAHDAGDDDAVPATATEAAEQAAGKAQRTADKTAEKAQRSADKAAEKAQKRADKAAEKAARTDTPDATESEHEEAEHTATSSTATSGEQEPGDDGGQSGSSSSGSGSSGSGTSGSGSGGHHGGDD